MYLFKKNIYLKVERFFTALSAKYWVCFKVFSFIWLPLCFFSGIRRPDTAGERFSVSLPFLRFNRNWYRAMAGGALLANAEIAGGMYVFEISNNEFTVVCKRLNYLFLIPCTGEASYRISSTDDVAEFIENRKEFNIKLQIDVVQVVSKSNHKERRVGKCEAVFHASPKPIA